MEFSAPKATFATPDPGLGWLEPEKKNVNEEHQEKSLDHKLLRNSLFTEADLPRTGPEQKLVLSNFPSPKKKLSIYSQA